MALRFETSIAAPDGEQYAGRTQARTRVVDIAARVHAIEALDFDGLNASESGHDPYLPMMLAAKPTQRIRIGTNVANAFPRSPMVTAQAAWDLQSLSDGRFAFGLGTQIKRHNEQRYGMPWTGSPVARMRGYLRCLRAIFASFQSPEQPTWFEGSHYRFTMLPPFFNPGPIAHPHIPVHLADANVHLSRLAGELCDSARLHPIATFRYTREVIRPALISDAMLTEWAVIATFDDFADRLRERCEGLFDTVAPVMLEPLRGEEDFLRDTIRRIRSTNVLVKSATRDTPSSANQGIPK